MVIQQVRTRAAARRASLFGAFIAAMPRPLSVLDLGGTHEMWRRWGFSDADNVRVTLANSHDYDVSHRQETPLGKNFTEWRCDVRTIEPAGCAGFDVVFSNSMFEHLYTRQHQQRLADAIAASGKAFFIQVPNRRCIIDPHFPHPLAAFFAMWPKELQVWALTRHGLGAGQPARSADYARQRLANAVPLDRGQLLQLFPGANIVTEWTFGLPMSLIAQRAGPIRT